MRSYWAHVYSTHSSQFEFRTYFISFRKQTVKLFDSCSGCERVRMSAVPQGAFAARKARQEWQRHLVVTEEVPNNEKFFHYSKTHNQAEAAMEQPMQYSSKLMNSIWGLYNRYSVHNLKKNTDKKFFLNGDKMSQSSVSVPAMFQQH